MIVTLLTQVSSQRDTMVWMCLEICDNKTRITQQLDTIRFHSKSLTSVSYEKYTLSNTSELVLYPRLSDVGLALRQMTGFRGKKMKTFPMITSHPYPVDFIDRMRRLFRNPVSFFDSAISELQKHGFDGYNVDFEPKPPGIVPDDAVKYCDFLSKFADRLHAINKTLQVDVANWSLLWNYTLLGKTRTDDVITMATYAGNFTVFSNALSRAVREIGIKKLQAGLMIVNPQTNKGYTKQEIDARFNQIQSFNVKGVAVWRMHPEIGTGSYWWTALERFLNQ